jgi:hypothetical protein
MSTFVRNNITEPCGFDGNPDLYGFGIRQSLYIQLPTVAVVASFLPRSGYKSFFTNTNLSLFLSSWIIMLKVSSLRDIRGVELVTFPALMATEYMALLTLLRNWISVK